jgi:hypothetical protein
LTTIYQTARGSDFSRLHPLIKKRFGFSSEDRIAAIGKGTMDRIWHGPMYTLPFLYVGTWRRIMFPEHGENVPFTIANYAYKDSLGRETVTWLRTFNTRKVRRFDAYMIYSQPRKKIIDYLGTHQHLAVDIDLSVDQRGGLKLRSGEQRFYEKIIGFRFPLFFSGVAEVCEWYDDAEQQFKIEVDVRNATWGKLFGYSGSFQVEWLPMTEDQIPADAKPRREERRE